jgi:DnaJ-domain-containing protein 1
MSFTKRILDSVNTFVDRVSADDTPLSHVDEKLLERELAARIEARKSDSSGPADNPRARPADSSDRSRAVRAKAASEREARIRGARDQRARAEKAARDRAYQRMKEDAARQARAGTGTGPRPGAGTGGQRAGWGSNLRREDPKIAEYYRTLNLSPGADFAEVKKAFRALMRKYHPDLHGANPKKQKAATELSMRVTQAYNELEKHLAKS